MAVQSSTKKWMFIGGGVIAAAALVVGFQNYPPQPKDAAGAIGAAQRYHEPQISAADVKVSQDELTTWIQSETFDRIVRDPKARKLFTDAAVADALADAGRLVTEVQPQLDPDKAVALADGGREVADLQPIETDKAVALADGDAFKQKHLVSPADADGVNVKQKHPVSPADADKMRSSTNGRTPSIANSDFARERDRLMALTDNNAAIMAATADLGFLEAVANNPKLMEALQTVAARKIEPE